MKLWITEPIDPQLPHTDYLAAPTRGDAEAAAARIGNINIVGELYTQLPCITPESLMGFIEQDCAIQISWMPNAAEQLGAFLAGKDPVET
jgi:hypothetical protein